MSDQDMSDDELSGLKDMLWEDVHGFLVHTYTKGTIRKIAMAFDELTELRAARELYMNWLSDQSR